MDKRSSRNRRRRPVKKSGLKKLSERLPKIINSLSKFKMPSDLSNRRDATLMGCGTLFILVFLMFFIWLLTNKNANAVFVNETQVGIIKMNKRDTADEIYNLAVDKLSKELGMPISVNEEVVLKPIHASKKPIDTKESVLPLINKNFTYKVEAVDLIVDGVSMAIVKNMATAEEIQNSILNTYEQEDIKIVEKGFVEKVETKLKFVEEDEIVPQEIASERLKRDKETQETYTVVKGDTVSVIASRNGMTLENFYNLNPQLNSKPNISIGQEVTIISHTPLLSVRIVVEETFTAVIPKTTETKTNSTQYKTYRRVIQLGKDGEKKVHVRITKINGFEVPGERDESNFEITVPPVPEIVEVGTITPPSAGR